jgi:hypothetical protein
MNTHTLNQGQQAAVDGFFDFLFSSDTQMKISGPGGVGKSFVMGHLIDRVLPDYFSACKLMGRKPEYDEVFMTATTNKAAEVVAMATGRPAQTIQSFLRLKVQDDHATGRSKLTKTSQWIVHERKILFIDEGYMIDGELLRAINEGTHNCKIVFVGDHCQLSPVTEPVSSIHLLNMPFFELTEPMRNAGQPALMAVCQQLRDTVETGVFHPIQCVPGVIDWADDVEMETLIGQTFAQQTRASRILSYTNARVTDYNEHIRTIRNLDHEYRAGEILVNTQAIQLGKSMLSVEAEVEIIDQSLKTELAFIGNSPQGVIELEVRSCTLKSSLGKLYTNVPLPADRAHYSELVRYYQKIKNWNRYFYLKNTFPDLRPRDAATVHKAQGSTYDTVFIDVGNLSTCHLANVVARLLYVGFTRAKNRVVLYGELDRKYGGVLV